MPNDPIMRETNPHLEQFERWEKDHDGVEPSWLFPLRKAGFARFAELGFPTVHQEDWRFTNVAPIARLPFKPAPQLVHGGLTKEAIGKLTLGRLASRRLVFLNGRYAAELSCPGKPLEGITVGSLSAALAENAGGLEDHLGRLAREEDNPFTALNTAFFRDGGLVRVQAGKTLEEPVHLLFISTCPEAGVTTHPRNLYLLGKGAHATILETYLSTVDGASFTNAVTEFVMEEGARAEHCKFQDESVVAFHVAAMHASLGRNANLISHSLAMGARLSRNNIRTALAGEGVECVLNGLYLTRGEQLVDHHMVVEHAQPHCRSHEYYNGILAGRSRGVFHGRILVRPAAQKTDAKQTNKNLLLSDEATVDTKPQLEIYADDVKCTHGATVGQLNEESIFYLRSRGLGEERARRMLIHAFAGEIIERIRYAPVREELDRLVWERLEADPQCSTT
ncbi:FeS assembly protein SufD [Verrucomicrobia bacterium]|nr:FeS assembly protein SufD [Verrucomicrobiota bacterium]